MTTPMEFLEFLDVSWNFLDFSFCDFFSIWCNYVFILGDGQFFVAPCIYMFFLCLQSFFGGLL